MGAAAGVDSSLLGSRIITSGEQWKICSRIWRAFLTGLSALRRLYLFLSSSPKKCIFGTFKFQDCEEILAKIIISAVQPNTFSAGNTLNLLLVLLDVTNVSILFIKFDISSTQSEEILF